MNEPGNGGPAPGLPVTHTDSGNSGGSTTSGTGENAGAPQAPGPGAPAPTK